jgi:hypothetical protein
VVAVSTGMKNPALRELDALVGDWTMTMSGAWFLDSMETEVPGSATFEWIGDAFVAMRSELGGDPAWDLVFGHSDANDAYTALYHDERGVSRVYAMTFTATEWTLLRQDPDFHQRFVAERLGDRIVARWDASEDQGRTWRKDFDVVMERAS